jgi:hypothetical protein
VDGSGVNPNSADSSSISPGIEETLADARKELSLAQKYARDMESAVKVLEQALDHRDRPRLFRMIITRYLKRVDPFNIPSLLNRLSLDP